jgi:hypothetical protein
MIFFHIPKTGGRTMRAVVQHCLPDEHFDCMCLNGQDFTSLWVRPAATIAKMFHQLPVERQRAVRCAIGEHVTMDVAAIFDRPSKFSQLCASQWIGLFLFFFNRTATDLTSYPFIKDLTLEEYLDSGLGLDHDNHQVRMLSNCPELDAPWDPKGRPISTPPVERRHLEMAKRNIEERFIVAAPMKSSPLSFGS